MWKDDAVDNLEEDLPDAEAEQEKDEEDYEEEDYEYEFDDFEDEEPRGRSIVLKILLAVFILCVAAAVVLFLLRFMSRPMNQKNDTAVESIAAEPVNVPQEPEDSDSMVVEPVATPEPTPKPTPEPTPTPPPFPEQYQIPGVEPGDLPAVRNYIQSQLDAIASDPSCPHWDSVTANEDCTVFTVVINNVLETDTEIAAVGKMQEFSRMYAAHAGSTVKEIRIDTMNRLGQLLWNKTHAV